MQRLPMPARRTLQVGVTVLVDGGRIAWIRPTDSEEDPGDAEVIDAGGATIVPGWSTATANSRSRVDPIGSSTAGAPARRFSAASRQGTQPMSAWLGLMVDPVCFLC